jgi:hypothetical protein
VQRVLDIDLDFFVHDPMHWPDLEVRPDPASHDVWSAEEAIEFLTNRCMLDGPVAGFVTENHGELFPLWRSAIAIGFLTPPFHVTHVDAHADLGLGESGYVHLLTELLHLPVEKRQYPKVGKGGVNDANHLAFSLGCRWIADLTYVYCEGGGGDELYFVMQGFDHEATHLQLAPMTTEELHQTLMRMSEDKVQPATGEPPVPYRSTRWEDFHADAGFDFVCLTRSPPYTPPTADALFEVIRSSFIQEIAL